MQDNPRLQPVPSDEALVARVALRDPEAFSLLYDRYARIVYALAAHMLGRAEAEDVVQEVFLSMWHKAGQYSPQRGTFSRWFMAIARHQAIDHLNRRRRVERFATLEDIDQVFANAKDEAVDLDEKIWRQDRAEAALLAMKTIPAEQRRVLALAYFGGLSQSQIAERLGLPLGTVKKRIRLGLQKLRAALAQDSPQDQEDKSLPRVDRSEHGL